MTTTSRCLLALVAYGWLGCAIQDAPAPEPGAPDERMTGGPVGAETLSVDPNVAEPDTTERAFCPVAHTCPPSDVCGSWSAPIGCGSTCGGNKTCAALSSTGDPIRYPPLNTFGFESRACGPAGHPTNCTESRVVVTGSSCNPAVCCPTCDA